jgi:hypothetical protein
MGDRPGRIRIRYPSGVTIGSVAALGIYWVVRAFRVNRQAPGRAPARNTPDRAPARNTPDRQPPDRTTASPIDDVLVLGNPELERELDPPGWGRDRPAPPRRGPCGHRAEPGAYRCERGRRRDPR